MAIRAPSELIKFRCNPDHFYTCLYIWHFATFRNIFQNAVKSRHVFLIQLDPHKDKYYTFWDPNFAFDNELFHNFFRFQLLNCKRRQQVSASFSCKLLFSSFSFGEIIFHAQFAPFSLMQSLCGKSLFRSK